MFLSYNTPPADPGNAASPASIPFPPAGCKRSAAALREDCFTQGARRLNLVCSLCSSIPFRPKSTWVSPAAQPLAFPDTTPRNHDYDNDSNVGERSVCFLFCGSQSKKHLCFLLLFFEVALSRREKGPLKRCYFYFAKENCIRKLSFSSRPSLTSLCPPILEEMFRGPVTRLPPP